MVISIYYINEEEMKANDSAYYFLLRWPNILAQYAALRGFKGSPLKKLKNLFIFLYM